MAKPPKATTKKPSNAKANKPPNRPKHPPRVSSFLTTLAVAWHVYSLPLLLSIFLFLCATPICGPFVLIYLIFFCVDTGAEDGTAPSKRSSYVLRSMPMWKYFGKYFPIVVHKSWELEPAFVEREVKETHSVDEDDDVEVDDDEVHQVEVDGVEVDDEVKDEALVEEKELSDGEEEQEIPGIIESSTKFDTLSHSTYFGFCQLVQDTSTWIKDIYANYKKERMIRNSENGGKGGIKRERTGTQYIFGYHPHGIIGMGAVGGIATEGTNWSKLFPGVPVTTLTIVNQFRIPLCRDYLLSLGLASVSKRSCTNLLRRGQSICILLGGAQESLLAWPGNMDLVLKKRQGFIKLAMQTKGTSVVPVLAFGENNLYDQVQNDPNSRLYKLQTLVKDWLGFTLPLIHARGMLNYQFGIIPYHRPINIVVGKPIKVEWNENPSNEQVEKIHGEYMDQVRELFDKYKHQFHDSNVLGDGIDYQELKFVE